MLHNLRLVLFYYLRSYVKCIEHQIYVIEFLYLKHAGKNTAKGGNELYGNETERTYYIRRVSRIQSKI